MRFLIDYLTGAALGFSVFYVLPISLVTWVTERRFGIRRLLAPRDSLARFLRRWKILPISHYRVLEFLNPSCFFYYYLIGSSLKSSLELAHLTILTSAINSRYFYEIVQME